MAFRYMRFRVYLAVTNYLAFFQISYKDKSHKLLKHMTLWDQSINNLLFYDYSEQGDIRPPPLPCISKLYKLTHTTMHNQQ